MNHSNKTYFENLDGLRFLAFLSVFIGHSVHFMGFDSGSPVINRIILHLFAHGDLGVNFFFVLSGFLITYLLLTEKNVTHSISIPKFFIRRLLRIWPVYFITVGLGFFILPLIFNSISHHYLPFTVAIPLDKLGWYAAFIANYDLIFNSAGSLTVMVLWSISVEEQFYLVWPLVTRLTSKYALLAVMCLLVLVSLIYRLEVYNVHSKVKFSTVSVINDLSIGAICTWLIFYSQSFKTTLANIPRWLIATVYLSLFVCLPFRAFIYKFGGVTSQWLIALEPVMFSLFFAFIILEQNFARQSLFKISRFRRLSYLGTISYGLYCYHIIALLLVSVLFTVLFHGAPLQHAYLFLFQILVSFALTFAFANVSFRYIESRFLGLKNRFAS